MTRVGIWFIELMERWMAWLERPFIPWIERAIERKRLKINGKD